jgi:peroxiredoxin
VELDLADKGLGTRSRRYALLAEDQVGGGAASRIAGHQIVNIMQPNAVLTCVAGVAATMA